jgi:hypothetical protein
LCIYISFVIIYIHIYPMMIATTYQRELGGLVMAVQSVEELERLDRIYHSRQARLGTHEYVRVVVAATSTTSTRQQQDARHVGPASQPASQPARQVGGRAEERKKKMMMIIITRIRRHANASIVRE